MTVTSLSGSGPYQNIYYENATNCRIDWGDGTINIVSGTNIIEHTYSSLGVYIVTISGIVGSFNFTLLNTPLMTAILSPIKGITNGDNYWFRTFQDRTNITSIPEGMFDDYPDIFWFGDCFKGCTGITGAVPELWVSHPTANGSDCFKGCTNASNYADIPNDWKGL